MSRMQENGGRVEAKDGKEWRREGGGGAEVNIDAG